MIERSPLSDEFIVTRHTNVPTWRHSAEVKLLAMIVADDAARTLDPCILSEAFSADGLQKYFCESLSGENMGSKVEVDARNFVAAVNEKGIGGAQAELQSLKDAVADSLEMDSSTRQAWLKKAEAEYGSDGSVEIDPDAEISVSSDGGAYVAAWVFVYGQPCAECDAPMQKPVATEKDELCGGCLDEVVAESADSND